METKKCKKFCKQREILLNKKIKTVSKKYKVPYRRPTKQETQYSLQVCKKIHCNESCKGFDFSGDTKKQKQFLKNFKNGFLKSSTNSKIASLKRKGAVSSCILVDEL